MGISSFKRAAIAALAVAARFTDAYPLKSHGVSDHEPCGKIRGQVTKWMEDNQIGELY